MKSIGFNEKITLILSFLILNNYFLLSVNTPILLVKLNFFFYLSSIVIFYFKNITENLYLKLFFLFILIISLGIPTLDWDPRSNYLFHGKRIFYDLSIFTVADNYASFSHNEYPTLVPAFASSLAFFVGYWNEVLPKISFTLMFLPPLILIYAFLKNTSYLIFLSIVFFTIGKFLFNGWVDGLVAIYFGTSALIMYIIFFTKNNNKEKLNYSIAFIFFISLTLIKNEGTALLLVLFSTTFLIKIYTKELSINISKLILLSFSFLPIISWKFFCYLKGIGYNDYINENILFYLLPRLNDIENFKLISYFIFLNEKFIMTLIFFLISFWYSRNKELFGFISISAITYIIILFIIYLSTPYELYWQLNSTAARVVKSLSFLLGFFGLYNLYHKQIKY